MALSDSSRLSRNNFDLLRLLFAGAVCLAHSYELSGFDDLQGLAIFFSSTVAVRAFFVVSGFLIFMSYDRSSSARSYFRKRVRRIYPAYATIVLLCATLLFAVSSADAAAFFSWTWVRHVAANLVFLNFLQPTLPGVFEANRLHAINGALWTIKIEVMFYLVVPLFGMLFRKWRHFPVLLVAYLLSFAYAWAMEAAAQRTGSAVYVELGRQLPGQLSYFMSGALLYYYLPIFERHAVSFLIAAILVLAASAILPLQLLEPLALAVIVIFFGLFLHVGNFGRYGDFSYGLYIIHFPVIQVFVHAGWFDGNPWTFLAAVVATSMGGAIAMWHLVEKRFLLRSSHYIAATRSGGDGAGLAIPRDAAVRHTD